jgi:hypothetical protein
MSEKVSLNHTSNEVHAAADSQPAAAASPAVIVEQLRAVRAAIGGIAVLTPDERRKVQQKLRNAPPEVLQAQINVIGTVDAVAVAVGQPMEEVQKLAEDANRWTIVEDELRNMLSGVEAANLVRRQQLEAITSRAAGIGIQLSKDPKHAPVLVPQIVEIRRLKRLARRKKATPHTPGTPAPSAGNGITSE